MRRLALSRKPAEPKTAITRVHTDRQLPVPTGEIHFSRRLQGNFQRIRCMREIDDGGEVLSHVNAFHATRDSFQRRNPLRGNFGFDFQAIHSRGQCGQTVRDVKCANHLLETGTLKSLLFAVK